MGACVYGRTYTYEHYKIWQTHSVCVCVCVCALDVLCGCACGCMRVLHGVCVYEGVGAVVCVQVLCVQVLRVYMYMCVYVYVCLVVRIFLDYCVCA